MPRNPRTYSISGYMHIYNRGNGRQILFEQRADYIYFLQQLKRFSSMYHVRICAFCLMENHFHLLVHDTEKNIPGFMRCLCSSYSSYFNRKYKRTGHVFEGRYKSTPIDTEAYLLRVFSYILNNPRAAHICETKEYLWSSYSRYGESGSFVDTSVFQDLIGTKEEYDTFLSLKYEDCPELEGIVHNDEWAKSVIREKLHIEKGTDLQQYDWKSRNEALRLLKNQGLTIRQIERLTGINRSAVQRA